MKTEQKERLGAHKLMGRMGRGAAFVALYTFLAASLSWRALFPSHEFEYENFLFCRDFVFPFLSLTRQPLYVGQER
jgi:hypothetical protein